MATDIAGTEPTVGSLRTPTSRQMDGKTLGKMGDQLGDGYIDRWMDGFMDR